LSDDPHHHLSIAYSLIVDNKRIADESMNLEFYFIFLKGPYRAILSEKFQLLSILTKKNFSCKVISRRIL